MISHSLFLFAPLLLSVLASPALAAWNSESRSFCDPASFPYEGSGYCSGMKQGWDKGGSLTGVDISSDRGTCQRKDRGSCQCEDCASAGTKCQDYRCPDDIGELRYNPQRRESECFRVGTNTRLGEETYDYCFSDTNPTCDISACRKGQYVAGCHRASPGKCQDCGALPPGKYWGAVGFGLQSCASNQLLCSVAMPGQFIKTPCSAGADAVVKSCAEYPGNKQSVKDMSPEQRQQVAAGAKGVFDVDRFYCPAGNLVLPLPANAVATADYTSFECRDGYYLDEQTCLPCSPGTACRFGRQLPCPVNYYSKTLAASSCTLCTFICKGNRRPLRCGVGSTFDGGCVACGSCGYSSDTGLACVDNNYEMQALKEQCSPSRGGDWQCKRNE